MATYPIRQFGTQGLMVDMPSAARTWAQLSRADNVRLEDGAIATLPAMVPVVDVGADAVYAHPFTMSDDSGGHIVCYADGTVKYYDSTADNPLFTPIDISPDPQFTACVEWSLVQVNDLLIVTNGIDKPHQISEADIKLGRPLVPMPNWPATYNAGLVSAFQNFLVFADVSVNGFRQRAMVMWSHPLAPGDTTFTFYDRADPVASLSTLAGEAPLTTTGRDIVGLQPLRDAMMIYLDHATWRMSYVGGGFVMAFGQVFVHDGATGPRAFAEISGHAIAMGYRDMYVHDGDSPQHIGDGKVTRWLFRTIPSVQDCIVAHYPRREETFFLYRDAGRTDATDALIFNEKLGAFTRMRLSTGLCALYMGAGFGRVAATYQDYFSVGKTYDTAATAGTTYAAISGRPGGQALIGLSHGARKLFYIDPEHSTTAHDPSGVIIEFDRADADAIFGTTGDHIKTIQRLYPHVDGSANGKGEAMLSMSVGTAMRSNEALDYSRVVEWDPGMATAVDTRSTGRYFGLRVRLSPGETKHLYLSGMDIDMTETGRQ